MKESVAVLFLMQLPLINPRLCRLTDRFYARVCLVSDMWQVMLELYFKIHMYVQFLYISCYLRLWACGCPECFCWGGRLLNDGRPSRSFVVGVYMTSVVLVPRMQGVLCAAILCLFLVMLWTYDEQDEVCCVNPKFYLTLNCRNRVSVGNTLHLSNQYNVRNLNPNNTRPWWSSVIQ
jgi:hypothetical protein